MWASVLGRGRLQAVVFNTVGRAGSAAKWPWLKSTVPVNSGERAGRRAPAAVGVCHGCDRKDMAAAEEWPWLCLSNGLSVEGHSSPRSRVGSS